MEYRKLGKSDLNVSVVTLGAWQYGCEGYWGKVELDNIFDVINKSVESGINIIDTAIGYDDSELIVGKAIKNFRDKIIIVSKGGADPKKIPRQAELSLKRLGIDYLDLYLVHYPDVAIPIEDTIQAMAKLKKEGKIKNIGVSNFNVQQLERAVSVAEIACCESAYNLMWREIEQMKILDYCHKNDIGILTYSSLGQGLFTGKIRSADDLPKREGDIRTITLFFKGEAFEKGLEMVNILDDLSKKYGKTVAQIALNWVVYKTGVTSAIMGIENTQQLSDNLAAIGWKMEKEDYDFLSSEGSRLSGMFDYASYSMFGFKWEDIKVDAMLDATIAKFKEQ
jgi:methylglyoxal reductase